MAEFVKFVLDDGSEVFFESAESDLVTLHGGEAEIAAGGRLRAGLEPVAEAASQVAGSLRSCLASDEVALEFGLSALRGHIDDLGAWLAIWDGRREPDAHARRCASDAVDVIEAALHALHEIRQRPIGEIHASDDASAARADALLRGPDGGGP